MQSQDKLDSEPVEIDTPEINTDAQNSADLEETLPYSYGSPNNDKDSAPSSDLDATLPYSQGIPSVNNSDLDKTLSYSQGIPDVNTLPKSNSTDDLYSMESFLEGGVLPKLFKKPKKDKPLILGLQSHSPTGDHDLDALLQLVQHNQWYPKYDRQRITFNAVELATVHTFQSIWKEVNNPVVTPPNCKGSLLHWRIIAELISKCPSEIQQRISKLDTCCPENIEPNI